MEPHEQIGQVSAESAQKASTKLAVSLQHRVFNTERERDHWRRSFRVALTAALIGLAGVALLGILLLVAVNR